MRGPEYMPYAKGLVIQLTAEETASLLACPHEKVEAWWLERGRDPELVKYCRVTVRDEGNPSAPKPST